MTVPFHDDGIKWEAPGDEANGCWAALGVLLVMGLVVWALAVYGASCWLGRHVL